MICQILAYDKAIDIVIGDLLYKAEVLQYSYLIVQPGMIIVIVDKFVH